jgi:hypothetical protein
MRTYKLSVTGVVHFDDADKELEQKLLSGR